MNINEHSSFIRLLLGEVLKKNRSLLGVGTPALDNNTRSTNNLSGVTLSVESAQTGPLTKLLGVGDLDQRNLLVWSVTESLNELNDVLLGDRVAQDAKLGFTLSESLGGLSETSGKTIVNKRGSKNSLEAVLDRNRRLFLLNDNFLFNDNVFFSRHDDN